MVAQILKRTWRPERVVLRAVSGDVAGDVESGVEGGVLAISPIESAYTVKSLPRMSCSVFCLYERTW
jgi:hypothetical protein